MGDGGYKMPKKSRKLIDLRKLYGDFNEKVMVKCRKKFRCQMRRFVKNATNISEPQEAFATVKEGTQFPLFPLFEKVECGKIL